MFPEENLRRSCFTYSPVEKEITIKDRIADFLEINKGEPESGVSGRYIILGHKEPDGDCVASQLTLSHFLKRTGKRTILLSEGPFNRPEISGYSGCFNGEFKSVQLKEEDRVVVVDCSTAERVGKFKFITEKCETLVIDHHASGKEFGTLRYIDKKAPSVTFMIQLFMESMGYKPDSYESKILLFGLCTDTGFFRHVDAGGPAVMHAAARLLENGASLKEAYSMMYGNRELAARKLLGLTLLRTESYLNNKILITYQTIEDRKRYSLHSRGADDMYRLLQTVKGVEVVAFVREEAANRYSIGLRSREVIDVGKLAGRFGGGGHRLASGFDMEGEFKDVKAELLRVLTDSVL